MTVRSKSESEDISCVVNVAETLEQYNLCLRDVSGCPWEFRHEDSSHMIMTREEKKVDWRKRVSYCLQPKEEIPYSQRRYHLSSWHLCDLEGFLSNPFAKLTQKMITTPIWDSKYGGQRRMMVYGLTSYFTRDRLVAVRKLDGLFKHWRVYG